jgi:hypothetical protein
LQYLTERPLVCDKVPRNNSPLQLGPHGRGRPEFGPAAEMAREEVGKALWLTQGPIWDHRRAGAAPVSPHGGAGRWRLLEQLLW